MKPLGTDFGNGVADKFAFQIDSDWAKYREAKLSSLKRKSLHVCRQELSPEVENAVTEWVHEKLLVEHPEAFVADKYGLRCLLNGEFLEANLDSMLRFVQEDMAVVSTEGEGESKRDWLSYVNVCFPSHWNPAEKVGQSFFDGHTVVPGMEKVNRGAKGLVDMMIVRGPWTRFVWGVETDVQLNHHPVVPEGVDAAEWNGRQFDSKPFVVRVERQVTWGLPEVGAAIFIIRVSYVQSQVVLADDELRTSLLSALESMSPEQRQYKGLDKEWLGLVEQLTRTR